MSDKLQKIINLAKRTGDRIIVLGEDESQSPFVVMSIEEYERIVDGSGPVKNLSEQEMLDKINRDISIWRSSHNTEYGDSLNYYSKGSLRHNPANLDDDEQDWDMGGVLDSSKEHDIYDPKDWDWSDEIDSEEEDDDGAGLDFGDTDGGSYQEFDEFEEEDKKTEPTYVPPPPPSISYKPEVVDELPVIDERAGDGENDFSEEPIF